MSGWYSTQLNEEIAVSFQMTKLFVNAKGAKILLSSKFSHGTPRVLQSTVWQTLPYGNIICLSNFAHLNAGCNGTRSV